MGKRRKGASLFDFIGKTLSQIKKIDLWAIRVKMGIGKTYEENQSA